MRGTRLRLVIIAAIGVVFALGSEICLTQLAQADDTPSSLELMDKCNHGTDSCTFHPDSGPKVFADNPHQIGNTLFNCGPGSASKSVSWTDTSGERNSFGISMVNAQEGSIAGWFGAFKTEFEITFGHRWGNSDSTTRATDIKVNAGEKGWLVRSTPMQTITGTYELHFGKEFHGHYYWYVPFTITAPAPEATSIDVVSQREEPMSPQEKTQCV
jgi:hypothetical protein